MPNENVVRVVGIADILVYTKISPMNPRANECFDLLKFTFFKY